MFRNTNKSEINQTHFGVGSVIHAGSFRNFLVIGRDEFVFAVDSNTYQVIGQSVKVADKNWMDEAEARELVNNLGDVLNYTYSDFTLYPAGMKGKKFGIYGDA